MKARAGTTPGAGDRSLWAIFRAPLLLGLSSLAGLLSALLGDGAWDALSWALLGLPVMLGVFLVARRVAE